MIILVIHSSNGYTIRPHRMMRVSSRLFNDVNPQSHQHKVLGLIDTVHASVHKEKSFTPLWDAMRYEAAVMCEQDMKATTLLTNAILSQPTFESAAIDFLSNQLETPLFQGTQIRNIFEEMCNLNSSIPSAWALDLLSSAVRDKSQPNTVSVLLFNRGFHALATHRIAHTLWYTGRDGLALFFQSVASRVFSSDIHPACHIGPGCYISTGSGVVIGETASIGRECCIKHGVTLGGTGKESGDRHPKLGNGVFVAAGASILGNIIIGDNSVVNAGSVVTKPVAASTRVGGVPARFISNLTITTSPPNTGSATVATIQRQGDLAARMGFDLGLELESTTELEKVSETKFEETV